MGVRAMTTTVNVHDAKTHFSKLIQRVLNGEEVIIAKAGQPVAILSPLHAQATRRVPGNDAGKVRIMPSFEEPLPEFDAL